MTLSSTTAVGVVVLVLLTVGLFLLRGEQHASAIASSVALRHEVDALKSEVAQIKQQLGASVAAAGGGHSCAVDSAAERLVAPGVLRRTTYKQLVETPFFLRVEAFSNEFIRAHAEAMKGYFWTPDALHEWSRAYEYPFFLDAIEQFDKCRRNAQSSSSSLAAPPTLRVLDAGSGVTFMPWYLASRLNASVQAVDSDARWGPVIEQIGAKARASIASSAAGVRFRVGDLRVLPFEEHSFGACSPRSAAFSQRILHLFLPLLFCSDSLAEMCVFRADVIACVSVLEHLGEHLGYEGKSVIRCADAFAFASDPLLLISWSRVCLLESFCFTPTFSLLLTPSRLFTRVLLSLARGQTRFSTSRFCASSGGCWRPTGCCSSRSPSGSTTKRR